MPNEILDRLIESREDAKKKITLAMANTASKKTVDADEAVEALDRMIAQQTERLAATKASLASAVERLEGDIRVRQKRIDQLQELAERHRKGLEEPSPPEEPERPVAPKLRDVKGIGPASAQKLRAAGINSVEKLSKAPVMRVVEVLGVTEEKAKSVIESAKQLLS